MPNDPLPPSTLRLSRPWSFAIWRIAETRLGPFQSKAECKIRVIGLLATFPA